MSNELALTGFKRGNKAPRPLDGRANRLTIQMETFIHHYCAYNSKTYLNASASAMAAGYSPGVAGQQGHNLLQLPQVKDAIQKHKDELYFKIDTDPTRILSELASIAHANLIDFYDEAGNLRNPQDLPRYITSALKSVKVSMGVDPNTGRRVAMQEITLHDKKGALETLLKFEGLLADKLVIEDNRRTVDHDSRAKQMRQKMLLALRTEDEAQQAIEEAMNQ